MRPKCPAGSKSKSKCLLTPGAQFCENCRFLDAPCTFDRTIKKRGPRKGYVTSLEQRLSSLETSLTDLRAGVAPAGNAAVGSAPAAELPMGATAVDGQIHRKKRQARTDDVDAAEAHKRLGLVPAEPPAGKRRDGSTTERTTVLGYLSIDENVTMRYHGPTSGLYLLTASRVFASPFWQFPNPGFWPRSERPTFRTEEDVVSAAEATADGILPSVAAQNKLLEYVAELLWDTWHMRLMQYPRPPVRTGPMFIHISQLFTRKRFSINLVKIADESPEM